MSETSNPASRYVIIGNGVAGTTAAETIRKADAEAIITILADEPYPLYNRIALPRVLKQTTLPERTIIRQVAWHAQQRIDLRLETTVSRLDTDDRVVFTADGGAFPYDKLLIATGGTPNPLRVPGAAGTGGIYNFQTLDDTKAILARSMAAKSAISLGGSFIAYELTEAFRHRNIPTIWLVRGPRFLHRIIDEGGGELVDRLAREVGVETHYGEQAAEVHAGGGDVTGVTTESGKRFDGDLLGVGIGLTLRTEFLAGGPVALGERRGVQTTEYLETNVPDVYAAGDIAEFFDVYIGSHNQMGTWNNAAAHGRTAAVNMMGGRQVYAEVPYYTSTMFESQMAAIGTTPDVRPDMDSLARTDLEARRYRRLFFLEGRLAGAVLIGDIRVRRQLMDIIKSRETVPPAEREKLLLV
ncbi:MAG TPA: FAD-dependent oxidoreductase [Chloroflexota bacterium]|nr:FAD-dependent oxidoreductase [Chloroflexota bacterium]